MKMQYFYPKQDDFYGVYYPNPIPSHKASTTGMLALAAASLFPKITLTIALTPPGADITCLDYSPDKDAAYAETFRARLQGLYARAAVDTVEAVAGFVCRK